MQKRKKTHEAPAVMRVGSLRKVTGLLSKGTPDLLSHGNIL